MNGAHLHEVWVYLAATPLLWLTATLAAYVAARQLWLSCHMTQLLNPVMVAIAVLSILLIGTGTDYQAYFNGAQFVHFLLGPATVALAIPLYRQLAPLRQVWLAVTIGLIGGSLTAALSAMGIAWAFGGSREMILSLAPKSATTPIAMAISEGIGGLPSVTTVLVLATGILGAMVGGWVLDRLRITDPRARGLALGTASHGVGTARALQMGEVSGAFSGLAMGINGLATAVFVPWLVHWLMN